MLKIACIIPSLCSEKSYPILKDCIDSLLKSAAVKDIELKVVVVTNGKKLFLKDLRKKINLLVREGDPYSFAKMNNTAISKSLKKFNPDWTLLINDDAYVERKFFSEFIKAIKAHKNASLISPLVYERNDITIDSFGIEYFNSGYAKNSPKLGLKTQLVAAACLFVKVSLLNEMKNKYGFYFNSILFSYMDDVEFSIRARALGGIIYKSKKMIVHHMVSYTNGRRSWYVMYQSYRNIVWLIVMTWPVRVILKNILNIILVQGWIILYSLATHGPTMYIKLWMDTFQHFSDLLNLRRKIIPAYKKGFRYEDLLSKYAFRTYHGYKIRLW